MLTIQDNKLNHLHEISPQRVKLETLKRVHLINKTPLPRNNKDLPEQRNYNLISTQKLRLGSQSDMTQIHMAIMGGFTP